MAEPVTVVQPQPDLIASILSAPWVWLVIAMAIAGFVIIKLKNKKPPPETRPFWGYEVRSGVTKQDAKHRLQTFGFKGGQTLHKGFLRAGKVLKIEPIKRLYKVQEGRGKNAKFVTKEREHYLISFRKFGLMNRIKAWLGQYEFINVSPAICTFDYGDKNLTLDANAFIADNSGIWTMNTEAENELIDIINLQKDFSNLKGFVSDFPRRMSNMHPPNAAATEGVSHWHAEQEKMRKARTSSYVGGGS